MKKKTNQYYLIPITTTGIYFNGKELYEILKETYPELAQREEERINIIYSACPKIGITEIIKQKYNKHIHETKKIYNEKKVPQYLIAYGNDSCAEEILTKAKIQPKYAAALGVRNATEEEVCEYYHNSNYEINITNYFNNIKIVCKNPFIYTYDIDGYIEGNVNGQPIKGNFKGKIKTKKIIKRK